MRRIALLGLLLLIPACDSIGNYIGDPTDGFGGFIGDTHTPSRNVNSPLASAPNISRVRGIAVETTPLLPEPGNIWPGPPRPDPTLADIQREQNQGVPLRPGGSGTPPSVMQPTLPTPIAPPGPAASRDAPRVPAPSAGVVQTLQGPAVLRTESSGIQTYTLPNGSTGRAISNGNGTITLIGPDGSVQSVPAPR